ncbi:MAG TPA: hypothetical protein VLI39_07560 [Sedimentisphaerales bacterium]|nr:hypothetical protein [Sedimentisphaerales bacterium]
MFVLYWQGDVNATVAEMTQSGIAVTKTTAEKWLRDPAVLAAIQQEDPLPGVLRKEELQRWWTEVIACRVEGDPPSMADRLRASELLGKSFGAFTEKVEHTGELTLAAFLEAMARRPK